MESYMAAALAPQWRGPAKPPLRETEALLIKGTLQGRPDAFGDLVQPYLPSLDRLARMKLCSKSEAEDIVQQAVLLAFSRLSQFRQEASFKTWLSAIALREVSQLRRGQAVARLRPLHETHAVNLADPSSSPEAQCQRRQEVERLYQAVTKLPEKYRLMIQLRDLRELSIAETARSLSLTVPVVKIRHHRARKLLVRSLTGAQRPAMHTQRSKEEQPCNER